MQSPRASHSWRQVTARSARSAFAIAALTALVMGCANLRADAPSPDIQTVKASAHRLYRVSVRPDVTPIPVRRLQRWTLHLATIDGQPVDSATITMDGGMPQHGHGLPTSPRVTQALGNGDHLIEGVKFNMGGWWVVRFAITSSAGTDTVSFNLGL
jgi:YtkA-like